MAVLPLPARRRRRSFDPRVLIGLALVVASALGTTALVSALTRTVVVYRATGAIVEGDRVTSARLQPATVRLGDATGLYLTGSLPAGGLIAMRTVAAGELVPRSAVATDAATATATVVVDLAAPLSASVSTGSTVDLWSAEQTDATRKTYGPPAVLVGDAVVSRVVAPTGLLSASTDHGVELRIPRDRVAEVLAAQASGARLSAVEIGGAP